MAFEPDQTYEGVITEAQFIQSSKNSEGLNVKIKCPEAGGSIYHTIWLTAAAMARGKKTLIDVGVAENALRLRGFWTSPEDFLVDKPVRIVTELHEYDGKTSVRVKWLNGPNSLPSNMKDASKDRDAVDRMISLFGGLEDGPAVGAAGAPGGGTPFDDPSSSAAEAGTVEPPWDDEDDPEGIDHHTEKG